MKTLLYILAFAFTIHLSAQDPMLQKPDESLDAIATSITKKYDDQLGLDGEQFIPFQKVVEEYLIREENIHQKFEGEDKLDMIYQLREAETMEMRNILTQPQFNLYKRIKPQIQPLAVVDTDNDTEEDNR